jgi:GntR family transcriptional regulator
VPPYLQLVQQVRQAVLLGFLQPGDRLPLIREVVEDLAINPNTVAKAYRQMEQENLVNGRPGQGTFINEQQSAAVPASTYTSLRRGLATWLRRAYAAGLDEQAVNALFTSVHQQTRNEDVA